MAQNANTFGFKEQPENQDVDTPLPGRQRLYAKHEYADGRSHNDGKGLYYKMDDGRVVGPLIGWGFPIHVYGDWTDEANIWGDIASATGMDIPNTGSLHLYLWEGPNDPDDFATLEAGGAGPLGCQWDSAPVFPAVAYIVGCYFTCGPV